jgi:hypothetical protein
MTKDKCALPFASSTRVPADDWTVDAPSGRVTRPLYLKRARGVLIARSAPVVRQSKRPR